MGFIRGHRESPASHPARDLRQGVIDLHLECRRIGFSVDDREVVSVSNGGRSGKQGLAKDTIVRDVPESRADHGALRSPGKHPGESRGKGSICRKGKSR